MKLHSRKDLREQVAFLAYYFHWEYDHILSLSHIERHQFCDEIMRIHRLEQGGQVDLLQIK